MLMSGERGAITIDGDHRALIVQPWRDHARRFWNAAPAATPYWRQAAAPIERRCEDRG
jgi:hypothetical protein